MFTFFDIYFFDPLASLTDVYIFEEKRLEGRKGLEENERVPQLNPLSWRVERGSAIAVQSCGLNVGRVISLEELDGGSAIVCTIARVNPVAGQGRAEAGGVGGRDGFTSGGGHVADTSGQSGKSVLEAERASCWVLVLGRDHGGQDGKGGNNGKSELHFGSTVWRGGVGVVYVWERMAGSR